jgi:hypothetical protein
MPTAFVLLTPDELYSRAPTKSCSIPRVSFSLLRNRSCSECDGWNRAIVSEKKYLQMAHKPGQLHDEILC